MQLVDLRQLGTRQVSPLLEEEVRVWRDELHWDYRFSAELIKKFIETHSLAGSVVLENGQPAGYGFYVIEEQKGLLGGLFVSSAFPQKEFGQKLLSEIIVSLRGIPQVQRIEAQLMPFGSDLSEMLSSEAFRLYKRQFMVLTLGDFASKPPAASLAGLRVERWHDRHMAQCAELIHQAYAGHVDAEINDQYCSQAGAAKFLKNIVLLPGCGQFEEQASFVIRDELSDRLAGAVLTSMVAKGVGHTTQLCVLPEYRGRGLGHYLIEASVTALRRVKASELSLTVTSNNRGAVKLYEALGFRTIKSFVAAVWSEPLAA
jgi:ribosomal protein S18 acetylase RimI-like enzyme